MDFSLLQRRARLPLLRDITGLKRTWVYYAIMVVDPLLRFSWIFYAIFTHNTQHSTLISFSCSLAEVLRRGMWALLRVENEHCGNVAVYKASRDTPLPYRLEASTSSEEEHDAEAAADRPEGGTLRRHSSARVATATGSSAASPRPEMGTLQRRKRTDTAGKKSILQAMAEAHRQDFEKKKPTATDAAMAGDGERGGGVCDEEEREEDEDGRSEDDEDDEETGSGVEERMRLRETEDLVKGRRDV